MSAVCQAALTQLDNQIGGFLQNYIAQNANCASSCDPAISDVNCSADCGVGLRDLETNCHNFGGHIYQELVSISCGGGRLRQTRTYSCFPSQCGAQDISAFAASAQNTTCGSAQKVKWVTSCQVSLVEDDAYANAGNGPVIAGVVVGIVLAGLFGFLAWKTSIWWSRRHKLRNDTNGNNENLPILSQLLSPSQASVPSAFSPTAAASPSVTPQQPSSNYQVRASLYKPSSAVSISTTSTTMAGLANANANAAPSPGIVLRSGSSGGSSNDEISAAEMALLAATTATTTAGHRRTLSSGGAAPSLGAVNALRPISSGASLSAGIVAGGSGSDLLPKDDGHDDDDDDDDEGYEEPGQLGGASPSKKKRKGLTATAAAVSATSSSSSPAGPAGVIAIKGGNKLRATHGALKPVLTPAQFEEKQQQVVAAAEAAGGPGGAAEATDLDALSRAVAKGASAVKQKLKKKNSKSGAGGGAGGLGGAVPSASAGASSLPSLTSALLSEEADGGDDNL